MDKNFKDGCYFEDTATYVKSSCFPVGGSKSVFEVYPAIIFFKGGIGARFVLPISELSISLALRTFLR